MYKIFVEIHLRHITIGSEHRNILFNFLFYSKYVFLLVVINVFRSVHPEDADRGSLLLPYQNLIMPGIFIYSFFSAIKSKAPFLRLIPYSRYALRQARKLAHPYSLTF